VFFVGTRGGGGRNGGAAAGMSLSFTPIALARQDDYRARLARTPQVASDYSFVNLWAWADEYGLSWAWEEDLVWIRQENPLPVYWAPVGDWRAVADWPGRFARLQEAPLRFIRVPDRLTRLWRDKVVAGMLVEETREHWDYLYSVPELIELRGNRLHAKKNLLRQFKSSYRYQYTALDESFIEQVLLMQFGWCAWRECEASAGLAAENRVITKVLEAYGRLRGLIGGAVLVDGDVVAFTVAEALTADTLVVHFEKGMGGFKGVYQAINQMFLAANASFSLVNREQDLGNAGLRKAKLSYRPVGFLKKHSVSLPGN